MIMTWPCHIYNPVHEENGGWYFWDETQADRYGPYETSIEARAMYDKYCSDVLGV